MDRFSRLHQPDEGYSEAPLYPSPATLQDPTSPFARAPTQASLQAFVGNLGSISVTVKKSALLSASFRSCLHLFLLCSILCVFYRLAIALRHYISFCLFLLVDLSIVVEYLVRPLFLKSDADADSLSLDMAMALLSDLPTSVVANIVHLLNPRLFIDFVQYLPPEVCLKIFGYLDPFSLVNAGRTSRSWYELTQDPRLWKRLYVLEGWKYVEAEISAYEQRLSRRLDLPAAAVPSFPPSKRSRSLPAAVRLQLPAEPDQDVVMSDPDAPSNASHSSNNGLTTSSLFGGAENVASGAGRGRTAGAGGDAAPPASPSPAQPSVSVQMDLDSEAPAPLSDFSSPSVGEILGAKGKGKAQPSLQSALCMWDGSSYKVNWRYLYSMRRRLESNWDRAKFANFQIPHEGHTEESHSECIYSLQFDSQYLVSGSRDWTLRIWNLRTRRLARPPLRQHTGSVLCLQFDASPSEDIIVSGSSDASVVVWRFSTGEVLQVLQAHSESVLNVRFDHRVLVTCSKDKTIKVFNRQALRYGDLGYSPPSGIEVFSPATIRLRRYGIEPDLRLELPVTAPYSLVSELNGHHAAVNAVQVHGRTVVSASGDRVIKIWDWPDSTLVRQINEHSKGIACVQFDGRRIVSGSSDNEIKIFDSATGVEVANLPAHTSLVRTVQAGFADLPYSVAEDEAEARRVDERYFRALEEGSIEMPEPGSRNTPRHRNAGSSRPEDITSYGAKIPPGGGGSSAGRIVSGSYDQSIIIWRRDKEGAWKDQHHLRHSDALSVAAVQRQRYRHIQRGLIPHPDPVEPSPDDQPATTVPPTTTATSTTSPPPNSSSSPSSLLGPLLSSGTITPTNSNMQASSPAQGPPPISVLNAATIAPLASPPLQSNFSQSGESSAAADQDTGIQDSISPPHNFTALIDYVVPRGVQALQTALANYPALLTYHSQIQAAILREPSSFARSQLRQAVSAALLRAQIRVRHSPATQGPESSATSTPISASDSPSASTSHSAAAVAAATQALVDTQIAAHTGGSASSRIAASTATPVHQTPAPASVAEVQMPRQSSHQQQQPLTNASSQHHHHHQQQQPHHHHRQPHRNHHHNHNQNGNNTNTNNANASNNNQVAGGGGGGNNANAPPEVPEIRVFKLQFDARQIVCCSQTSVIIGWDFCNGDPELEETARFFGTVE